LKKKKKKNVGNGNGLVNWELRRKEKRATAV
jgi:hypothetical protein